jgi:predicted 3-demethylubiquinone-9 3-methyltransferase (glyoxalase superfamily)
MAQNPITPCIWSNQQGKETANLYAAAFPETRITQSTAMVVTLNIAGHPFMILNGGPQYQPNPTVSFFFITESSAEIDHALQLLSEGGKVMMPLDTYPWSEHYAWVQDRYGVSWQLFKGSRQAMGCAVMPALMFTGPQAGKAEEAIGLYTSVFPDSGIVDISRYEAGEPDVTGTIKHGRFRINGQVFAAMDSSFMHGFQFSEGLSLLIACDSQAEIDHYWNRLREGGEEGMCGWLKDRYGLSWQVVPSILPQLMADPATSPRVIEVFLQMKKFELEKLLTA